MKLLYLLNLIFFISLISSNVSASDVEFYGKITTFEKYPLNKVSITVKSTEKEVFTENDGRFRIVCEENDKLQIRANGFATKVISLNKLNGVNPIEVNLKLKSGKRNFELATVYGHVSSETLSHAIELVESKLDYGSYDNILDILTEKSNRVSAGESGCSIVGMRGTPLFIVDGSEVQYSYFKSIPTTDIESLAILRNTASARYGMKGYGGVIELVTKSK